jgi:5-methylcytosine-specific restriction enzyme A
MAELGRAQHDVQFARIAAGLVPVDTQVGLIANEQTGEMRRILRPCSIPGCPELTPDGPCEQHRRARQREHDERRGSSVERGYDVGHRRLRVLCFERDGWRCVDCGWEPDIVRMFREADLGDPPTNQVLDELRDRHNRGERHFHADHQVPIEERPDLRLDLDNLRTRCDGCHRAKTLRESRGTGRPVNSLAIFDSVTTGGHRTKRRRF